MCEGKAISRTSKDELAQALVSDERFREWFTAIDLPKPGEDSIFPVIFVGNLPAKDGDPLQTTAIIIAGDAWEDNRFAVMRMLGARCCDEGMQPVAVAIISEVWSRAFSPEEAKARGKRQVSDYEDRDEKVMLCGATIDGRAAVVIAPILRDADAVITGYGPQVSSYAENGPTEIEPTLLMEFFLGYLTKKFSASPPPGAAPRTSH